MYCRAVLGTSERVCIARQQFEVGTRDLLLMALSLMLI